VAPAGRLPGAILVVAALAVAGCAASDSARSDPETTTSQALAPVARDAPDPPPSIPREDDTGGLALVAEANRLGDHRLGDAAEVVVADVADVLGRPLHTEGVECPGGSDRTVRWEAGLTAVFADGRLSGWTLEAPSPGPADDDAEPVEIATTDGIGVGSPVAQLQAAFPDNFHWVPDSTLGVEFFIGSGYPYLGGLATGEGPDDTVEWLWAGDSCSFR
jgi:hypothetical protein